MFAFIAEIKKKLKKLKDAGDTNTPFLGGDDNVRESLQESKKTENLVSQVPDN